MSTAIVLLANVAASLALDGNGLARWLAAPAVGVLAAVATIVLQPPPGTRTRLDEVIVRTPPPRGGLWGSVQIASQTVVGAVLVSMIVVGGGGVTAAAASRYAMAWVTGNEHGPNRLIAPVTARAHGVVVTVDRIEQTPHFTRVTLTVRNKSDAVLIMPIDGGNCQLIAGDGTATSAQMFRSDWNESVDLGGVRTGALIFGEHLPSTATRARIAFGQLFGSRAGFPPRLVVPNLQLRPG